MHAYKCMSAALAKQQLFHSWASIWNLWEMKESWHLSRVQTKYIHMTRTLTFCSCWYQPCRDTIQSHFLKQSNHVHRPSQLTCGRRISMNWSHMSYSMLTASITANILQWTQTSRCKHITLLILYQPNRKKKSKTLQLPFMFAIVDISFLSIQLYLKSNLYLKFLSDKLTKAFIG